MASEARQYEFGQKVRLVVDEGLDTPQEKQGEIGVVTRVYVGSDDLPNYKTYDVTFDDGSVVYCEDYHIESPYRELRWPHEDYPEDLDMDQAAIITIDDGEDLGIPYVVSIARFYEDALAAVSHRYDIPVKDLREETSNLDTWGMNGKVCANFVAIDAPGETVAYGMWSLADAGYPLSDMMDKFLAP